MKKLAATGIVLVLGAAMAGAATKIKTQADPKFDFARLKTFGWNPSSPGDVKIWITADSKSEPVKRQYEPVLMQAVEENLTRRGFTKATTGPPDFVVTYYVLIVVGSSSQQMGQFLPTNAQFGVPLFAPASSSLEIYPQGSLILDAASPAPENIIWRAMAEAKVEVEIDEVKRSARIREFVKELVAKFPKPK